MGANITCLRGVLESGISNCNQTPSVVQCFHCVLLLYCWKTDEQLGLRVNLLVCIRAAFNAKSHPRKLARQIKQIESRLFIMTNYA